MKTHWYNKKGSVNQVRHLMNAINHKFEGVYEMKELKDDDLDHIPDIDPADIIVLIRFIERLRIRDYNDLSEKEVFLIEKRIL